MLECRHHRLSEQYLDDNPSSFSGTAPTDDQTLLTRACKYKSPVIASTSTNGPNGMCLSQPLLRLTPSKSTLISKINGLTANGDTNLLEGMMWGWRSLSPNAPLSEGKPFNTSSTPTNQKVLVQMTDGYNNWSAAANTWGRSNYEGPGYYMLANGRMPPTNQNITTASQSRAALDELLAGMHECQSQRNHYLHSGLLGQFRSDRYARPKPAAGLCDR